MLAFGLGLGSLAFEAMAAGFGGIGARRTGRPELMVAVCVVFALLGVTTALTGGVPQGRAWALMLLSCSGGSVVLELTDLVQEGCKGG